MTRAEYDYAIAGRPLVEIDDAGQPVARRARVADIITIAANLSDVSVSELMGKRQLRRISRVRFAIYAVARENGHTARATGRQFGGKDHSTVSHGCRQLAEFVKRDPDYAAFVAELRAAAAVAKPFVPQSVVKGDKDEGQGIALRQDTRDGSRALAEALAETLAG